MASVSMKHIGESSVHHLTVGTEVSAKYRGAFCEAQIKSVKRNVLYKITSKKTGRSCQVTEEHIKGVMKVGCVVEAQFPDQTAWQESVIQGIKDRSSYTVIFDDGDERTLTRGSLCLKGDRHFAKSETLDNLPLTDPENFGTPVLSTKKNRRRRPIDDEYDDDSEGQKTPDRETPKQKDKRQDDIKDPESSSEEEQDDDDIRAKWLADPLMGKVVIVEPHDKRKHWFPGLVVNPLCYEGYKKLPDNELIVRSFKTGKFSRNYRSNVKEFSPSTIPIKVDASWKNVVEDARNWKNSRIVPNNWKIDIRDILDENSSNEDEDGSEEDSVKSRKKNDDRKSDNSLDSSLSKDEKNNHSFLEELYKFMEDRGSPINKTPVLGYKDLDLNLLYRLVQKRHGSYSIQAIKEWKQIYLDLGIPKPNPAAGYNVKTAYMKYLGAFEEYCASWKHLPLPSAKPNTGPKEKKRTKSSPKEQENKSQEQRKKQFKELGRGKTIDLPGEVKTRSGRNSPVTGSTVGPPHKRTTQRRRISESSSASDITIPSAKPEKKKTGRGARKNDDKSSSGSPDSEPDEESKTEKISRREAGEKRQAAKSAVDNPTSKRIRRNSTSNVSTQYSVGDKLKVKYGQGKTFKLYDAKVIQVKPPDGPGNVMEYLVHYAGWNARHDEWIRPIRIVGFAEDRVSSSPAATVKFPPKRPKTPLSSRSTSHSKDDNTSSSPANFNIDSKMTSLESEVPDVEDDLPYFEEKKPRAPSIFKKNLNDEFRRSYQGLEFFEPVVVGMKQSRTQSSFEPPHLAPIKPKTKEEPMQRKSLLRIDEKNLLPKNKDFPKKEIVTKLDSTAVVLVKKEETPKSAPNEDNSERSNSPSEDSASGSVSEISEDNSMERDSPTPTRRTSTRRSKSPAYLSESSWYPVSKRRKLNTQSDKSSSPTPPEKIEEEKSSDLEKMEQDPPRPGTPEQSSDKVEVREEVQEDNSGKEVQNKITKTRVGKGAKSKAPNKVDSKPSSPEISPLTEEISKENNPSTEYDTFNEAVPNIALEKPEVEETDSQPAVMDDTAPESSDTKDTAAIDTEDDVNESAAICDEEKETVEENLDQSTENHGPEKKDEEKISSSSSSDDMDCNTEAVEQPDAEDDKEASPVATASSDGVMETEEAKPEENQEESNESEPVQINHNENIEENLPAALPSTPQNPPSSSKVLMENTPPTTPEHSPNYISEDMEPEKHSPGLDSDTMVEERKDNVGSASSSGCEQVSNDGKEQTEEVDEGKIAHEEEKQTKISNKKKKRGGRSNKRQNERRTSYTNEHDTESDEDRDTTRRKRRASTSKFKPRKKKAKARPEPPSAPPPLPIEELEGMPQDERIAVLQARMAEMRKIYHQLKQEVANIDRKRKRAKRREREAAEAQSLASKNGSSPSKPICTASAFKSEAPVITTVAVSQPTPDGKTALKAEDSG